MSRTLVKTQHIPTLVQLQYKLPASWEKAAGFLRGYSKALMRHAKKVRLEWGK